MGGGQTWEGWEMLYYFDCVLTNEACLKSEKQRATTICLLPLLFLHPKRKRSSPTISNPVSSLPIALQSSIIHFGQ